MEKKLLELKVYGRVQGVYYRYSCAKKALELGINGYVKNQDDGSVFIEAEGTGSLLDEFLVWCYSGPPLASVQRIEMVELPIKNYSGFNIKK